MPMTPKEMVRLLWQLMNIGGIYEQPIILSGDISQSRRRRILDFFPDFPECFSQGETMEDAYEMAVDALGLCDMEHTNTTLPKATPPQLSPCLQIPCF